MFRRTVSDFGRLDDAALSASRGVRRVRCDAAGLAIAMFFIVIVVRLMVS